MSAPARRRLKTLPPFSDEELGALHLAVHRQLQELEGIQRRVVSAEASKAVAEQRTLFHSLRTAIAETMNRVG